MRSSFATPLRQLAAWAIALVWIIPFLGLVMTSIRPFEQILQGWWDLTPFTATLQNFVDAWYHNQYPLHRGMLNSLIVDIPATVIPMIIASLAAYGFARFRIPFKNWVFVLIVLLMALPPQMIAIPVFSMLQGLGLLNTFAGLILLHTVWGTPWITFFMRNFFGTIPVEMEEAARVDGASDWTIFWKIIIPMSVPALLSVGVLQFMWVWSDFFFPLITIFDQDKMLAVQMLPFMRGQFTVDWGLLTAATVMVMMVPVLIFALLQRYYVRGMVGWGVGK